MSHLEFKVVLTKIWLSTVPLKTQVEKVTLLNSNQGYVAGVTISDCQQIGEEQLDWQFLNPVNKGYTLVIGR